MSDPDLPVFFISYARWDAWYPEHRDNLQQFVDALSAEVANGLGISPKGVCFIDRDIRAGQVWSDELGQALMRCKVGLALYTPSYFNRTWCGKEFQVLLTRSRPSKGGTGIVPVRWLNIADPPACAARIQYDDSNLPSEYSSMGMRQLVALRAALVEKYQVALRSIANRIIEEARATRLAPLASLDFSLVRSAWEQSTENDAQSHTQGNISKTCFVFISRSGWGWTPYEGTPAQIGALAQKIAGELGLKYEEIPCDSDLPQKLAEANSSDVPTVLFADPDSVVCPPYESLLKQYDSQYLLNCATLVAWEPKVGNKIESDPRWLRLKTSIVKQKIDKPPPFHEWKSIFSQTDLDLKTRTLVEQMRSRLMKKLVSDVSAGAEPRKAEDLTASQSAAALGIDTSSVAQLESPSGQAEGPSK